MNDLSSLKAMMELRINDRVYIFVFLLSLLMITCWHLHLELKEVCDISYYQNMVRSVFPSEPDTPAKAEASSTELDDVIDWQDDCVHPLNEVHIVPEAERLSFAICKMGRSRTASQRARETLNGVSNSKFWLLPGNPTLKDQMADQMDLPLPETALQS